MTRQTCQWFKMYPHDYLEGTRGLTLEQRGAYMDCLCIIYSMDKPIVDDPKWLSHQLHISVRKAKSLMSFLLSAKKLVRTNQGLDNDRARKERMKHYEMCMRNKRIADEREKKKLEEKLANVVAEIEKKSGQVDGTANSAKTFLNTDEKPENSEKANKNNISNVDIVPNSCNEGKKGDIIVLNNFKNTENSEKHNKNNDTDVTSVQHDHHVNDFKKQKKQKRKEPKEKNKKNKNNISIRACTREGEFSLQDENQSPENPKTYNPKDFQNGHRLPDYWQVSDEIRIWARSQFGVSDEKIDYQSDWFRDHFFSAPGIKGSKKNWDLTFKNWLRRNFPKNNSGHSHQFKTKDQQDVERMREAQEALARLKARG